MVNLIEKFNEARPRMQKYIDVISVILLVLDTNGNITLLNKSGCDLLEVNEKDILGKNWIDTFILEKDKDRIRNVFDGLIKGDTKAFTKGKNDVVSSTGKIIHIDWTNGLVHDENTEELIGIVSSGLDVTEKDTTEEALLRIERKFEAIVQASPDVILIIDKNKILVDVYPDSACKKYPGLAAMRGNYMFEFLKKFSGEEHAYEVDDIFNHIIKDRTEEYTIKETIHTTLYGDRVFDMTFKAFNDDKILAILRDITEKEKLQVLMEFQAAINKLSENNRRAMDELFHTQSLVTS